MRVHRTFCWSALFLVGGFIGLVCGSLAALSNPLANYGATQALVERLPDLTKTRAPLVIMNFADQLNVAVFHPLIQLHLTGPEHKEARRLIVDTLLQRVEIELSALQHKDAISKYLSAFAKTDLSDSIRLALANDRELFVELVIKLLALKLNMNGESRRLMREAEPFVKLLRAHASLVSPEAFECLLRLSPSLNKKQRESSEAPIFVMEMLLVVIREANDPLIVEVALLHRNYFQGFILEFENFLQHQQDMLGQQDPERGNSPTSMAIKHRIERVNAVHKDLSDFLQRFPARRNLGFSYLSGEACRGLKIMAPLNQNL